MAAERIVGLPHFQIGMGLTKEPVRHFSAAGAWDFAALDSITCPAGPE